MRSHPHSSDRLIDPFKVEQRSPSITASRHLFSWWFVILFFAVWFSLAVPVFIADASYARSLPVVPTRVAIVFPTATATLTPEPIVTATGTPMPTATPLSRPHWLDSTCIYAIEQMVQQEVGDLENDKASLFVAAQIYADANNLQSCAFDRASGSTLSKRWWLIRRLIPDERTAHAVDLVLQGDVRARVMKCGLVGSLEDVMLWKSKRADLRIGYSDWVSDGRISGVFGLNCSETK